MNHVWAVLDGSVVRVLMVSKFLDSGPLHGSVLDIISSSGSSLSTSNIRILEHHVIIITRNAHRWRFLVKVTFDSAYLSASNSFGGLTSGSGRFPLILTFSNHCQNYITPSP